MAKIIDGTKAAEEIKSSVKSELDSLGALPRRPLLATVLVGEDPGSKTYVTMKTKAAAAVGMLTRGVALPAAATLAELSAALTQLAADPAVDGILLQLPLPPQIDQFAAVESIPPGKDVDGLTSANAGLVACGRAGDALVSCTPRGIVRLVESVASPVRGKHVVVVNHSTVVGRPLGQLLLNRGATVTTCHVDTRDLVSHLAVADVVVTAVGKAGLVRAEMIKPGAVVIDGGYSRVDGKIRGDAEFETVSKVASWITPPTGGVGPMTIAMLVSNTLKAFKRHVGIPQK